MDRTVFFRDGQGFVTNLIERLDCSLYCSVGNPDVLATRGRETHPLEMNLKARSTASSIHSPYHKKLGFRHLEQTFLAQRKLPVPL